MKTRIFAMAVTSALILAVSACTMPFSQNSNNHRSNMAATITAQALIIQDSTSQAKIKRPIIRSKNTPAVISVSTPGAPMVSVSSATNCRTGPSTDYDLLYTLAVGQTAEVVGKYSGGNYWVVKNPSGAGNCWLWGQYATIIGNTDSLPEMIPPPAPPTAVPAGPTMIVIRPWHPKATAALPPIAIATTPALPPIVIATTAVPTFDWRKIVPYLTFQP